MGFIWLQSRLRESLHSELDTVLKFQADNLNFKEWIILTIELAKAGPICVKKFQQMATQEAKVQNFYANCMEVNGNLWILRYFSREVASDFLFLCPHLLEFQNEAWPSLDQLKGGCGAPRTFPLAPLDFEYLALPQVYTFFRWRLYILHRGVKNLQRYCKISNKGAPIFLDRLWPYLSQKWFNFQCVKGHWKVKCPLSNEGAP